MRLAWLVAWREIRSTVFTWMFMLGNLAFPLFPIGIGVVVSLPAMLGVAVEHGEAVKVAPVGHVVVLDRTGRGVGARLGAYVSSKQLAIQAVLAEADTAELDRRVQRKEIAGWVELDAASVADGTWAWHGHDDPASWVERGLQHALSFAVIEVVSGAPEIAAQLGRLHGKDKLRVVRVPDLDVGAGAPDPVQTGAALGMVFAIMISTSWIAGRTAQENQKGLVDQLVCTVPAYALVLGKGVAASAIAMLAGVLWSVLPVLLGVVGGGALLGAAELALVLGGAAASLAVVTVWLATFTSALLALVFVQVAVLVVQPPGKRPGLVTVAPVLVMQPMVLQLMRANEAMDPGAVRISSYLPIVGAPFVFLRYARGSVPLWVPVVHVVGSLAAGLALAALVVLGGRVWSALGGWPRSLAEVRAALALQR